MKDAIATVLNRNTFYRDGYRLMLRISVVQLGIIVLLIAAIVALTLTMRVKPVYFATTSDGRIISIVPLNEQYLSQAQVVTWAASTSQNIMRFGYHDFRERLQQVANEFTPAGWTSFNEALKASNFIEAVQARKLVVTLDINGAPEIQHAFVNKGVYTWIVQFPVTIRFDGNQPPEAINTMLRLQIVRVSTLQNPAGISIAQWVLNTPAVRQ